MMKILSVLTVLALLSGCVNVHVHFPAAQDAPSSRPADAGGNEKK